MSRTCWYASIKWRRRWRRRQRWIPITRTIHQTAYSFYFPRHQIEMRIHANRFRKHCVARLSFGIRCVIFTLNWNWMFTCVRSSCYFFCVSVASDGTKLSFDGFLFRLFRKHLPIWTNSVWIMDGEWIYLMAICYITLCSICGGEKIHKFPMWIWIDTTDTQI